MMFKTVGIAVLAMAGVAHAADTAAPVSFTRDLRPLLNANCNACHKPDKSKADLDMTTYASLMKGSKKGAIVVPGEPAKSKLMEVCSGPEPEMPPPEDGKPLSKEQLGLIERWIVQGAKDDTAVPGLATVPTPIYTTPPVITTMAWSPDGKLLAVSGYHEVVVHAIDGSGKSKIVARLIGDCPRIESVVFSPDGARIGVAGGAPGEFGQVQIWDVKTFKPVKTLQPAADSLYGLSFSPDGKTVGVGGADKVARRIDIESGKIVTDFRAHADWVLATTFTLDGKQMVTGGRDKALKLVDIETGRFVDDINNPLEQVLCVARHPKEEKILYGGELGVARIYKISDNQGRTNGRIDTNLLTQFERMPAAVTAVAFSPDGAQVALGTEGEVRIYDAGGKAATAPAAMNRPANAPPRGRRAARQAPATQGKELLTLDAFEGPVYTVAWKPDASVIAAAGFDGSIRLFDAKTGNQVSSFSPVPLKGATATGK